MNVNICIVNFIKVDLWLNEQFQSYCDMEFNDLVYSEVRLMLVNDKYVMELMSDFIKLENDYYQFVLFWRNDFFCLENNRLVVEYCFKLLK